MPALTEMILAGDLRSISGAPRDTEADRAKAFASEGLDYYAGMPKSDATPKRLKPHITIDRRTLQSGEDDQQ